MPAEKKAAAEQAQPTVYEALNYVMGAVQAVGKNDRNQQQGYIFRGVDSVVNAVGPALREHGVIVVPVAEDMKSETYTSKGGALMRNVTVKIRWVFYGPAGDSVEAVTYGEAADAGDKAVPKAHSVAYRVALLQALCIPTHDPDPDSHAHERVAPSAEPTESEPTEGQVKEFGRLGRLLMAADNLDSWKLAGTQVHSAKQAKEITPEQYERLVELGTACQGRLKSAAAGSAPEGEPDA